MWARCRIDCEVETAWCSQRGEKKKKQEKAFLLRLEIVKYSVVNELGQILNSTLLRLAFSSPSGGRKLKAGGRKRG